MWITFSYGCTCLQRMARTFIQDVQTNMVSKGSVQIDKEHDSETLLLDALV